MAIEKALGIDAPPRATHVRTILIEFSRMTSHLAFLSWLPWRVADFSRSGRVHHLLDTAHDLWEGFCGNRIHPMTCRIGGTAHDVTPVFAASLNTWCMHAAALSDELRSLLDGPAGACTRGVAVIPADAVAPFGLSGPGGPGKRRADGSALPERGEETHIPIRDHDIVAGRGFPGRPETSGL